MDINITTHLCGSINKSSSINEFHNNVDVSFLWCQMQCIQAILHIQQMQDAATVHMDSERHRAIALNERNKWLSCRYIFKHSNLFLFHLFLFGYIIFLLSIAFMFIYSQGNTWLVALYKSVLIDRLMDSSTSTVHTCSQLLWQNTQHIHLTTALFAFHCAALDDR